MGHWVAWLFWALDFLELGAMVGCGAARSVGNHAACEVLSAAAGVTAPTAHGQPASRPQTKPGPGGAERTDDRCREAGAGRARRRGLGEAQGGSSVQGIPRGSWAQQSPHLSGQWPCPAPTPVTAFTPIVHSHCTGVCSNLPRALVSLAVAALGQEHRFLGSPYPANSTEPRPWGQGNGVGFLRPLHGQHSPKE